MLPIDENAKSGAWVLLFLPKSEEGPPFVTAFWSGGERGGWFGPFVGEGNYGSYWCGADPVGYLPVPLVENAAKMREELEAFTDLVESDLCRELPETRQLLSATEWPQVKG